MRAFGNQIRKDPITGRRVLVETEKPLKPDDYLVDRHVKSSAQCPFCPGNEPLTPHEIAAYGRPNPKVDAPGWKVRVVPNRFPAVTPDANHVILSRSKIGEESTAVDPSAASRPQDDVFQSMPAFGRHEVIVDHPDHKIEMADLEPAHIEIIVQAFRDRIREYEKDPRLKYALVFKNYGPRAGASLEHPHTQIVALPVIPSRADDEFQGSEGYFKKNKRCIFCDILQKEREAGTRITAQNDSFLAFSPFAARFPFELMILPTAHGSRFQDLSQKEVRDFAALLKTTLFKLKTTLKDPSYNLIVHSLPLGLPASPSFHWHVEIIPKLTRIAAFEWGTGFYVNPTSPEAASRSLSA